VCAASEAIAFVSDDGKRPLKFSRPVLEVEGKSPGACVRRRAAERRAASGGSSSWRCRRLLVIFVVDFRRANVKAELALPDEADRDNDNGSSTADPDSLRLCSKAFISSRTDTHWKNHCSLRLI
jgi:hypothetical protein